MGETYNPIGQTKSYENGFFSPIPIPPPGYAHVLTGGQNEAVPLVIQSRDIPRKEQIRQGKYCWITPVDIQTHGISFDADLLANDNISYFHLTITATARVEHPGQVCLDNTTNVAEAVRGSLLPELRGKAVRYQMDDIQQFRDEINNWLRDIILLNCGIQLSNIHADLRPDQAYINRKEALRKQRQEQEDKFRKLQETAEYEKGRARVADELSKVYGSDVTQVFAEFASGAISPEEASKRIEARRRTQSAEGFDEKMRQMRAVMDLVKMMQDNGIGSPDTLAQRADQLWEILLASSGPSLDSGSSSIPALDEGTPSPSSENLYMPPSDD